MPIDSSTTPTFAIELGLEINSHRYGYRTASDLKCVLLLAGNKPINCNSASLWWQK